MGKNIYILLIISVFSLNSQTKFLPKQYLTNAVNYAHSNFSPNAEMYAITSLLPVDTTGKSATWLYWFYKPNVTDSGYTVNIIVIAGFPIVTGFYSINLPGTFLRPLGTAFCESNLAIQAAENAGGRIFRLNHPNTIISAAVFKIPLSPDTSKPYWTYLYRDTSSAQFMTFNIDGITCTHITLNISQISIEMPEKFSLYQNYPNPFNPKTKIKFDIPETAIVKVGIYNAGGKEVYVLVNEELTPGIYEVTWDASDLPSGAYFYTINTGSIIQTKKMVLIK